MTIPFEGQQDSLSSKDVARYLVSSIGVPNAIVLTVLVCLMSVLDMAGVAIIFPFLHLVTQPEATEKWLAYFGGNMSPRLSHTHVVLLLGAGLAVLYTLKTIMQANLLQRQGNILAQFTAGTTNDMVSGVLSARYAVFQETAASEIGGTAYSCTVHATLALTALIQAGNEGLVLMLLFLGFLLFEPMIAVGALLFAVLAALLLYQIVIRRSSQIGEAQSRVENVRYRLLFSLASAIRDIKIMGLDGLFDTRNRQISSHYASIAGRYSLNVALPRLLIEYFALLAIIGIALGAIVMDMPSDRAGPLLGLIAVATVRAIPGFYRFFSAISAFRSSQPFVARLIALRQRLVNAAVVRREDSLVFAHSIELKHVGFSYGAKSVLKDISLELKQGESIGIVGSSGAGKTTLLDIFTGLQPATEGQFYADGKLFDPFASHGMQRLIGYVPQAITLFDETIQFNICFEEHPDLERVMRAITMANLQAFVASLPDGIKTRVGENGLRLSGGQRQRIGIARALYRRPQILVFDEATSALDTLSERELTAEIEQLRGRISLLVVAHRLSTVMSCDRIYVLANGKLESSGTHAELLLNSQTYKTLYNTQLGATAYDQQVIS